MKYPSEQFDLAIAELCQGALPDIGIEEKASAGGGAVDSAGDNQITPAATNDSLMDMPATGRLAELKDLLKRDPAARQAYLSHLQINAMLHYKPKAEAYLAPNASPLVAPNAVRKQSAGAYRLAWYFSAAAILTLLVGITWMAIQPSKQPIKQLGPDQLPAPTPLANISQLNDVVWIDANTFQVNSTIHKEQRIEIKSGTVQINMASSASVQLTGPASAYPLTANSFFLSHGQATIVAETPESHGFILETAGARFTDLGTIFSVSATKAGESHLNVIQGRVAAEATAQAKWAEPLTLDSGQMLTIKPASKITTRIEAGEHNADFSFPTIPPPSRQDAADHSRSATRFTYLNTTPTLPSKPADVLVDGKTNPPTLEGDSFFFPITPGGDLLMDLGREVDIKNIHVYTWLNKNNRGRMRFKLYGYAGERKELPESLQKTWGQQLRQGMSAESFGFAELTSVSTDLAWPGIGRVRQTACNIFSPGGTVGEYRYLLWRMEGRSSYQEIDVFENPDAAR